MFNAKSNYAGLMCLCLFFAKAFSDVGQKCDSSKIIDEQCSKIGQKCDSSKIIDEQCSKSEQCDDVTETCQCLPLFSNENGTCILPRTTPNYSSLVDNQGNGSLVAGILIPLFLITFVICSIYVGKRFELVKWLRQRLNQRNRNYDEFMIGHDDDDDPPLA